MVQEDAIECQHSGFEVGWRGSFLVTRLVKPREQLLLTRSADAQKELSECEYSHSVVATRVQEVAGEHFESPGYHLELVPWPVVQEDAIECQHSGFVAVVAVVATRAEGVVGERVQSPGYYFGLVR